MKINDSKIVNRIKKIGDLLEEIEEIYEDCERKIDVKEVIEWWDGRVIMDLEYLYYVMKGENDKFDDDGVVLKSISKKGLND